MGGESSLKPLLQRQPPPPTFLRIPEVRLLVLEVSWSGKKKKNKKKKARVSALETGDEIPQFRRVSWPVRGNLVWPWCLITGIRYDTENMPKI